MLKDMEGNLISLVRGVNGHMLVCGKSGQGKTYFLVRMLEEYCEQGIRVLVLDFSGSYTDAEMQEKGFLYTTQINRFTMNEDSLRWMYRTNNKELMTRNVAEALLSTLDIKSFYQRKLLIKGIARVYRREGNIGIPEIIKELEIMYQEEMENDRIKENIENITHLLSRLYPFSEIKDFRIEYGEVPDELIKPITIIDMTKYPESQRKFLTEFILSLLWREIYYQEKGYKNRCDALLLDEIQFISMKDGSTLGAMLREGRKKHLDILLSSQFISHLNKDAKNVLQQADTKIIFCPTPEDLRYTAKLIAPVNPKIWEPVLHRLQGFEAFLRGHYRINNRSRVCDTPIVIRAVPQIEVMKEDEAAYARKTVKKVDEGGKGD